MSRGRTLSVSLLLLLVLLSPVVTSESAGDVSFSAESINISPSNPVEGDDVDFTVTLTNLNSSQISGVDAISGGAARARVAPYVLRFGQGARRK